MNQSLLEDYLDCYVAITVAGYGGTLSLYTGSYGPEPASVCYGKLIAHDTDFIKIGNPAFFPTWSPFGKRTPEEKQKEGRLFYNQSNQPITTEEAIKLHDEITSSISPALLNKRILMQIESAIYLRPEAIDFYESENRKRQEQDEEKKKLRMTEESQTVLLSDLDLIERVLDRLEDKVKNFKLEEWGKRSIRSLSAEREYYHTRDGEFLYVLGESSMTPGHSIHIYQRECTPEKQINFELEEQEKRDDRYKIIHRREYGLCSRVTTFYEREYTQKLEREKMEKEEAAERLREQENREKKAGLTNFLTKDNK